MRMKRTRAALLAALCIGCMAMELRMAPREASAAPVARDAEGRPGKWALIENLLSDIRIPKQSAEEFNRIFLNHRQELEALLFENPLLIWDTVSLITDALPALWTIGPNGGRLVLDRDTYSRAANLLAEFEALAGPQLASDLRKFKVLVDGRIRMVDSEKMLIDLN